MLGALVESPARSGSDAACVSGRAGEGGARLWQVNKSDIPDATRPKYDASLEMNRVHVRLEQRQYRDLVRAADFFGNYERVARYNQFRPRVSPHARSPARPPCARGRRGPRSMQRAARRAPLQARGGSAHGAVRSAQVSVRADARAWWRFAFTCISWERSQASTRRPARQRSALRMPPGRLAVRNGPRWARAACRR
jgi:hypothetical protein